MSSRNSVLDSFQVSNTVSVRSPFAENPQFHSKPPSNSWALCPNSQAVARFTRNSKIRSSADMFFADHYRLLRIRGETIPWNGTLDGDREMKSRV